MLPQAILVSGSGTGPELAPPRNCCYVTRVTWSVPNQAFHPMKSRFACGSMVLLFSFSQKNSQREFFCEKELESSTLPEAQRSSESRTA
jgi:hypothetical protein